MTSNQDVPLSERLKTTFGSLGGGSWLPSTAGVFRSGNAHAGDSDDDSDNQAIPPPAMTLDELAEDIDQGDPSSDARHARQRQQQPSSRSRRQFEHEQEEDENDRMAMGARPPPTSALRWADSVAPNSPPFPHVHHAAAAAATNAAGISFAHHREVMDEEEEEEEEGGKGRVGFAGSIVGTQSSFRSTISSLSTGSRYRRESNLDGCLDTDVLMSDRDTNIYQPPEGSSYPPPSMSLLGPQYNNPLQDPPSRIVTQSLVEKNAGNVDAMDEGGGGGGGGGGEGGFKQSPYFPSNLPQPSLSSFPQQQQQQQDQRGPKSTPFPNSGRASKSKGGSKGEMKPWLNNEDDEMMEDEAKDGYSSPRTTLMISEAAAALAAQAILASSKLARKSTMARGGTRISRSDAGGPAGSNSSGGGAVVMVTGTGNASATSGGGMGEIKEEDTPNPPGGIRGGSGMLEYEAARKVRFNEEDVIGHEAGEMQDKLRTGSGSWTATSGGAAASAAAAMRARSRSSSLPVLSENDHSILRGAQDGASAPLSDPNAAASSGHDLFDWTKKSFVPDHVKNPHRYTVYALDEPLDVGDGEMRERDSALNNNNNSIISSKNGSGGMVIGLPDQPLILGGGLGGGGVGPVASNEAVAAADMATTRKGRFSVPGAGGGGGGRGGMRVRSPPPPPCRRAPIAEILRRGVPDHFGSESEGEEVVRKRRMEREEPEGEGEGGAGAGGGSSDQAQNQGGAAGGRQGGGEDEDEGQLRGQPGGRGRGAEGLLQQPPQAQALASGPGLVKFNPSQKRRLAGGEGPS